MRISCMMMCKDESDLLPAWGRHHGELFGYENLHVFDNGSTESRALEGLDELEGKGAQVDRSRSTAHDFMEKGQIVRDLIQHADATAPADFYLPLDCDEFVGMEIAPFDLAFDRSAIEDELGSHLAYQGTLAIQCAYDNNPSLPGRYFRSTEQRKTFFAQGACEVLDHGYHVGRGKLAETRRTRLIYMHYHYKPFELLRAHAVNKLAPYVDDLSPAALDRHEAAGVPGSHLLGHLRHRTKPPT